MIWHIKKKLFKPKRPLEPRTEMSRREPLCDISQWRCKKHVTKKQYKDYGGKTPSWEKTHNSIRFLLIDSTTRKLWNENKQRQTGLHHQAKLRFKTDGGIRHFETSTKALHGNQGGLPKILRNHLKVMCCPTWVLGNWTWVPSNSLSVLFSTEIPFSEMTLAWTTFTPI